MSILVQLNYTLVSLIFIELLRAYNVLAHLAKYFIVSLPSLFGYQVGFPRKRNERVLCNEVRVLLGNLAFTFLLEFEEWVVHL